MTQIIFRATTATTVAAGGVITTGAVQLLPDWAPPIQYIGTTDPWHVIFISATTMTGAGATGLKKPGLTLQRKVRAYGRRSTLYTGKECFASAGNVKQQYGSVRPTVFYIATYRAIGELVRP
jgi:hypothetical protein